MCPPPSQPSTYFQDHRVSNALDDNTSIVTEEEDEELLHSCFFSSDAQSGDMVVDQQRPTLLPNDYNLTRFDIVCGRTQFASQHCGNHRFRVTISIFLQQYLDRPDRGRDRSLLFIQIVDTIRSSGARFVKYSHGEWSDIGDIEARRKVGRALRDAVAFKDKAKPPKKTQTGRDSNQRRNALVATPEQYDRVDCVGPSTIMGMNATSFPSDEPHQDAEPRDSPLLDEQRIMNGSLYQPFDLSRTEEELSMSPMDAQDLQYLLDCLD